MTLVDKVTRCTLLRLPRQRRRLLTRLCEVGRPLPIKKGPIREKRTHFSRVSGLSHTRDLRASLSALGHPRTAALHDQPHRCRLTPKR